MLVTLEGLDGSGKTTVWRHLETDWVGGDRECTFTYEPTGSWYGDAVRRSIETEEANPIAELFLFTADHADHLTSTIEPALDRGEVVISDRYSDSRYAYQGASLDGVLDRPVEYIQAVHEPFTRPPDRTIFLDVSPETGAERSGATNKLEQTQFLERVRDIYEDLIAADPDRFRRVDAERPIDVVTAEVESVLESVIADE
ncbi:MAG: dTMP kinase [Halodesulfurarchaeum sp.]